MFRTRHRIAFCQLLLMFCSPVMASDADARTQSAPQSTVVITGQSTRDGPDLERRISQFVQSHSTRTHIDQYARWQVAVCPQILGLPGSQAAFVTGRINQVAKAVAAPTREPCEPNITVAFATEPQKLLNYLSARESRMLGYYYVSETTRVTTVNSPIQAWYATATRGDDGFGVPHLDDPYRRVPPGGVGSKLKNGLIAEFAHVLVVVDMTKVEGYKLGTVADYVALLALSQPGSLTGCSALPSILDLLSPACGEREKAAELTDADVAYLKALYDMNVNALGSTQRGQLSRLMRHELLK